MPAPSDAPLHLERHPLFTAHAARCTVCRAATKDAKRRLCLVGTRLLLTLLKRGEAVQ